MRALTSIIAALGICATVPAFAQGCIEQDYFELSGSCLGGGTPYRIALTNNCVAGVTVYFEQPKWGRLAHTLSPKSSGIHYGCTVERASVLGFCLWTDDHDKCGRGRLRNILTSANAFPDEVKARVTKIESLESEIINYGIRNKDIAEYVETARTILRDIHDHSALAQLDGIEDGIREVVASTSASVGRPPLRLSLPVAIGSRVSVHSAAVRLYRSFDIDVSSEVERAAVPKAARLFEQRLRVEFPNALNLGSAYQAFFDLYSQRMRADEAAIAGLEKYLYAVERLESNDRFRTAAVQAIRAEHGVVQRYSSGRGMISRVNHTDKILSARKRIHASRIAAVDDEREQRRQRERLERQEQEERRERQRRLEEDRETRRQSPTYMGSAFDAERAEVVMFGSNPDKFRVAPPKRSTAPQTVTPKPSPAPSPVQGSKKGD